MYLKDFLVVLRCVNKLIKMKKEYFVIIVLKLMVQELKIKFAGQIIANMELQDVQLNYLRNTKINF